MRTSMNRWFARTIATTLSFGFAVGSLATLSPDADAQGPLDRVSANANAKHGRYLGPLDRQSVNVDPTNGRFESETGFSVLNLDPSPSPIVAKRLVRKSTLEVASAPITGDQQNNNQRTRATISNAMAEAARTVLVSHQQPTFGKIKAQFASTDESIERPGFEDEGFSPNHPDHAHRSGLAFEQPRLDPNAFSNEASVTSSPIIYPEAFQQEPLSSAQRQQQMESASTDVIEFEGTYDDFRSLTEQTAVQDDRYAPFDGEVYTDEFPQPTDQDYMAHGHIGYEGSPDAFSFGFQDGRSFGFDNSRLYHPLEGPTTQLMGSPTVSSNFGQCAPRCNPWASFCRGKDLDYVCGGPGLKANPGHLGIPWLRSKDDCDLTEPLFGRCKTPLCKTPFWKSNSGCNCGRCK